MRVGLLGGSFNPAHQGHVHISLIAMRTLKLDAIWWLVTPQNPLKKQSDLKNYEDRMRQCHELVNHPRILVTDLEAQFGSNYTYDTICSLRSHFPATEFAFITGMDNALSFHRWDRWQDILKMVTTVHIARPPAQNLIQSCPLKLLSNQRHHVLDRAEYVDLSPLTTYWIKQRKMMFISSTQIRNS